MELYIFIYLTLLHLKTLKEFYKFEIYNYYRSNYTTATNT